jgi:proteasome lid subunit RPN8/RPN11
MPRQNFISRDFFVRASEKEVKKIILGIPEFASHIKFVQENKLVDSLRFCYQRPNKLHNLDVSLLPLDDQFTSVSLHASHTNGQSFYSDADLSSALHDFELAIQAGLKGNVTNYMPFVAKTPMSRKFVQFTVVFLSSISLFFLKKKLS